MGLLSRSYARCLAIVLVCALVTPSGAFASAKPMTPEKAHARILKRGLGNWVGVEVSSGAAFVGRITNIDNDSFGIQLHNDPQITQVYYDDIVDLHTGAPAGAIWGILAAGIGGIVVLGVVAHHEMSQMPKLPTLPTQPPIY